MSENSSKWPRAFLSQPIRRLLVICFVLVALIPISLLAVQLYNEAWKNAWREINEKHRLLAMNLAAPISIYVNDHRAMLGLLAELIASQTGQGQKDSQHYSFLDVASGYLKDFRSLTMLDPDGRTRFAVGAGGTRLPVAPRYAQEACFIKTRKTLAWSMSGIKPSLHDGSPVVVMGEPIFNADGTLGGVLLGELRIDLIEKLRRNIKFGERGHSAIVDAKGRVVAHPNPDWMKQMRDLSHLSVVKKMMAGETGVTEFYSPFVKQQMVAGYTSVPEIGWGIMVPQPKSEVERNVNQFLLDQARWALVGLLAAGVMIIFLAYWITHPINRLAQEAADLVKKDFRGELPRLSDRAPFEVRQLGGALNELVSGLQDARSEVESLNRSLQRRVDGATATLREANSRLEDLAAKDHLTSLANRRQFERILESTLDRRKSDDEPLCLMLIDVDNLKAVNDGFGHAAGDAILVHVSKILKSYMRQGDIVARYGGDEFAVQMRCNVDVARARGWEILKNLDKSPLSWKDKQIHVSLSIGLLHQERFVATDCDTLLREADAAMYEAKRQGRNTLVERTV